MSWNGNRGWNGNSNGNFNNNYNRGWNGNSNGKFNNNNNNNKQQKKHSGCTAGKDRNDNPYVQGWKYDQQNGMRRFYAAPYKGTKKVTSESGKQWENWFVRVTLKSGQVINTSGMYDVQARKVIIRDFSFVMNPKGGKGGYVGPFYIRK